MRSVIRAIIFDCDDTLFNYTEADKIACNKTFDYLSNIPEVLAIWTEKFPSVSARIQAIRETYKEIVEHIKLSTNMSNKHNKIIYFKKLLNTIGIPCSHIDKCYYIYQDVFLQNMKMYNGLEELLSFVRSVGIKTAVLSNNRFEPQFRRIRSLGIDKYFDHILTSDEIGDEKPCRNVLVHVLDVLGTTPQNTIMVGDSFLHDIYPSLSMGLLSFLFTEGGNDIVCRRQLRDKIQTRAISAALGTYFEFNSYVSLLEFIRDLVYKYNETRKMSAYFSMSQLCVQGTGGNLSVKLKDADCLFIKSSGTRMGDTTDGNNCLLLPSRGESFLESAPLVWGSRGRPSMEYGFHVDIPSRWVVHLHFIPVLHDLCSCASESHFWRNMDIMFLRHHVPADSLLRLKGSCIYVPYKPPGASLRETIRVLLSSPERSTLSKRIYFLQNHGIIICADTATDIKSMFHEIWTAFAGYDMFDPYLSHKLHTNRVIKNGRIPRAYQYDVLMYQLEMSLGRPAFLVPYEMTSGIDISYFLNVKAYFPDVVVFFSHSIEVKSLLDVPCEAKGMDLLVHPLPGENFIVFILATNVVSFISLLETLSVYCNLIRSDNNGIDTLSGLREIEGAKLLCDANNKEEEYRKTLLLNIRNKDK